MDRSDIITLYPVTATFDEYGVPVKTATGREVFCKVDSVTRAEFFEAGRSGLNPEYMITMFFGDYEGETIVGYNNKLYYVYRTYKAETDIIELYVEKRVGTSNVIITSSGGASDGES